ncbi:MAG: hypothetical protein DMF84_31625 [Acidobacteria bacterium]|nr:MAG: hypothetical protein DMF84_31625 [Acidobacteriota bacterium]
MSQRLVGILAEEFRDSTHVTDIGLRGMEDARIWTHARAHGFAIVSKDSDFRERSYVEGFPPKVIWLDVGTAGTAAIGELLTRTRTNRAIRGGARNVLAHPLDRAQRLVAKMRSLPGGPRVLDALDERSSRCG